MEILKQELEDAQGEPHECTSGNSWARDGDNPGMLGICGTRALFLSEPSSPQVLIPMTALHLCCQLKPEVGFPGSKESACQCRGPEFDPSVRMVPGEENGNPLQYSCLENPMDSGDWQATVLGVTELNMTKQLTHTHTHTHTHTQSRGWFF